MLLSTLFLSAAKSDDNRSAGTTLEERAVTAVRIVDQYGRQARSGIRGAGSQVFDVTVGPVENEFQFVPDTVNITVGDTVRWTWETNDHSVTSGDSTSCTADGQFCSPDNMNCDAGILNDTGFMYEHTFTEPGTYQYFCALHCFIGMTGVVNVAPSQRPTPTPRPRPTPHPRQAR
jgi:plastocyanin